MTPKFVADDGTVCESREEMEQINQRVDKLFLHQNIEKEFKPMKTMEEATWFILNVANRNRKTNRTKYGIQVFQK